LNVATTGPSERQRSRSGAGAAEPSRATSGVDDGAPRAPLESLEHTIGRLVSLGVRSDEVTDLLSLLWSTMPRPMAVVDPQGAPLASAPAGEPGRSALAAGLGAVEGGREAAPAGWQILPLTLGREALGLLAVLADPALDPREQALLEVARSLLADQLRRAALWARVLDERRNALKGRLVSEPRLAPEKLKGESERAQMPLADHYWPAVVRWERGEMDAALLASIEDLVHRHAREHITIRHDARTISLLVAQDAAGTDHEFEVQFLVEQVVEFARSGARRSCVRGIVAEASVPMADVAVRVEHLRRLCRYLERRHTVADRHVLSARSFSLQRLLEGVDRRRAADFVSGQIGPVLAYDRAHGASLADTLEIALDTPNRDEAAKAAYMHRNTFRRHLNHALELIDNDLADPDQRLAVHVALKLTKLLGARSAPSGTRSEPLARSAAGEAAGARLSSGA